MRAATTHGSSQSSRDALINVLMPTLSNSHGQAAINIESELKHNESLWLKALQRQDVSAVS